MPVGPASRRPSGRAARGSAPGTVVVHPLVHRIEPVVDVANPFGGVGHGPGCGTSREPARIRRGLRRLVECVRQSGERGEPAVDPFAVYGDEELLRYREMGEVSRESHRTEALGGTCPVDCLQGESQACAGGIHPDRRADGGIVRRRRDRSWWVGRRVGRGSGGATGEEPQCPQCQGDRKRGRRPRRLEPLGGLEHHGGRQSSENVARWIRGSRTCSSGRPHACASTPKTWPSRGLKTAAPRPAS